jgi:hypothetical protein
MARLAPPLSICFSVTDVIEKYINDNSEKEEFLRQ